MRTISFAVILLLMIVATVQAEAETQVEALDDNGISRSYRLYIPETEVSQLLIVLHPSGSSARAMELRTGLNAVADKHGFAVVYPDSQVYNWNDGRGEAGQLPIEGIVDDVGFLGSLIDELVVQHGFDPQQVYLTGLQNGGLIAYRAACEMPERFAAVIPVAAMMWDYQVENCGEAYTPVNMFIIHGAAHPNYKPEGEEVEYLLTGDKFSWLGWQDTVDLWLERNQCNQDEPRTIENSTLAMIDNCQNDISVNFWPIENAGDNWPRMANNTTNRFGVDISEVIGAYIAGVDWQSMTVPENSETELARSYFLYIPETYDPTSPTPLVVNLHGRLSSASSQAYTSDFNTIADREGFIVLYPNAIDTEWTYLYGVAPAIQHNDEEFLGTLIDDISQDLNIDANRVYVTGLSNGGFMVGRLACTMRDRFAAFAAVAATAQPNIDIICEDADSDPAPIMYIHGTADTIVPAQGLKYASEDGGEPYYVSLPMQTTMAWWAFHNGCDNSFEIENLPIVDPETETRIARINNCPEDAPAILYVVIGGGHVWHGTHEEEYDFLGQNSQDFNASEEIWTFFSQHTLEGRVGE